MDPLGRTALSIAIINENPELMEILLDNGILTYDSLLLAIDEEYVEVRTEISTGNIEASGVLEMISVIWSLLVFVCGR